jgi:hypothetical protein
VELEHLRPSFSFLEKEISSAVEADLGYRLSLSARRGWHTTQLKALHQQLRTERMAE